MKKMQNSLCDKYSYLIEFTTISKGREKKTNKKPKPKQTKNWTKTKPKPNKSPHKKKTKQNKQAGNMSLSNAPNTPNLSSATTIKTIG